MSSGNLIKHLSPGRFMNKRFLMNIITRRNSGIRSMSTLHRNNSSRQSLPFNRIQSFNRNLFTMQEEEIEETADSNRFTTEELATINKAASEIPQDGEPRLLLSWICANCGTRCAKTCRKRSYYETLVIMRCDNEECKKWQLMSDHLHWFKDDAFEIQKLLEENDTNPDPQLQKKLMDIINTVKQRNSEETEQKEVL